MTERDGPEKEVVKHVLAAFLIFNPEDFLNSLAGVAATRLQESYVRDALESLRSVISAGTLPYRLICSSVQQRHFDRIHTAERIRCLKDTEPGEGLNAQDDEQAFRSASQIMQEFVQSEEGTRNFRDRIVYEMNHALDSIEVAEAASELLVQTLISTWSAFESSTRTFIISFLNDNPRSAKPILESPNLKSFFGKQVVDIDVIDAHGFDLSKSMGHILFHNRRLDNLGVIRSVLDGMFSDADTRLTLGDDMWRLNQQRHLFVHKRGIVDSEYLGRTSDTACLGQRREITRRR